MVDKNDFQQGDGRQFTGLTAELAANDGKINTDLIAASFTDRALEQMGLSSSCAMLHTIRGIVRNGTETAAVAEAGLKITEAEISDKQGDHNNDSADEKRMEQQQWEEKQHLEQERLAQERWEQEQWEEKQHLEEEALKNRPQEDALNNRIMAMPFVGAGALFGLEMTKDMVGLTGNILSGEVAGLEGSTMVATNNNGNMLSAARAGMGLESTGQDMKLAGPNMAVDFTPGETPAPAATAPAPGTAPGMQQNAVPGMTPSMG
ncbi:MAG: hypothetical protein H6867_02690 [Rhodospirillales bacterium]|nr:hypothetical protein [Rhodospirillales bacterium]MCB9997096.1 hypothetical protein [Rhodospirillales bacterium]